MISFRDSSLGLTDEELVQMCLEGDRLAWDTLIDRYHNRIYSIAVKFDSSECEDVDAFFQSSADRLCR